MFFIGLLIVMSVAVILLCLLVNMLLTPVWRISDYVGNRVYKKLGF